MKQDTSSPVGTGTTDVCWNLELKKGNANPETLYVNRNRRRDCRFPGTAGGAWFTHSRTCSDTLRQSRAMSVSGKTDVCTSKGCTEWRHAGTRYSYSGNTGFLRCHPSVRMCSNNGVVTMMLIRYFGSNNGRHADTRCRNVGGWELCWK